jgi:carbon-monoxide dehydrogenase small subunit
MTKQQAVLPVVEKVRVSLTLNGEQRQFEVYPMSRLLELLRDEAGLTGTKEGCGEGECGACAVLMNGELVNSCLVPAIQADGTEVTTIEGLAEGELLSEVQKAFIERGAVQCGMCSPGMVMAIAYLLKQNAAPEEKEIKTALAGNLCRCTGYMKIFESVSEVCRRLGLIKADGGAS